MGFIVVVFLSASLPHPLSAHICLNVNFVVCPASHNMVYASQFSNY